jgi:hypothetical protein
MSMAKIKPERDDWRANQLNMDLCVDFQWLGCTQRGCVT